VAVWLLGRPCSCSPDLPYALSCRGVNRSGMAVLAPDPCKAGSPHSALTLPFYRMGGPPVHAGFLLVVTPTVTPEKTSAGHFSVSA
jgi:hypothetical protein